MTAVDRPETAEIAERIAAVGSDAEVGAALHVLARAALPAGFTARFVDQGFTLHDLRFECAGHWLYSAVLNQKWALFYVRRPAFREAGLDPQDVLSRFPDARLSARHEVKIRLHDRAAAEKIVALIAG